MNAKHFSLANDWRTPADIVERARLVLGDIDLDPASDAAANEVVKAKQIITAAGNGLTTPWWSGSFPGSVFLNPPGGRNGRESLCQAFWEKLMDYKVHKGITHAIFVSFSIEALQTSQKSSRPMMSFPFCIPAKRIRFVPAEGAMKQSPTHANAIIYVPGTEDHTDKFEQAFTSLGIVKK